MAKILGSWSGMRKYLEQEMLAECLRGRIRYNCTSYVGMDGDCIFELYVDDVLQKRFSLETVNSWFVQEKRTNAPRDQHEYWDGFWELLRQAPVTERPVHTDEEFCQSLEVYRNQDVFTSLSSSNPIERMLAVLDRRVGKRTLRAIMQTLDEQPKWLGELYLLRFRAEGLIN